MQIATQICAVNQDMLEVVKDLIKYKDQVTLQDAIAHERSGFSKFVKTFLN